MTLSNIRVVPVTGEKGLGGLNVGLESGNSETNRPEIGFDPLQVHALKILPSAKEDVEEEVLRDKV